MSIKKVVLEYDTSTGGLTDARGVYACAHIGLESFEYEGGNGDVIELVKLGATCEDIIKMKHAGLIK